MQSRIRRSCLVFFGFAAIVACGVDEGAASEMHPLDPALGSADASANDRDGTNRADGATPPADGKDASPVDGGADVDAAPDPPTCGVAGYKRGVSAQSITVNGASRTYQLYVPQTYDGHAFFPLIFAFHGDGGNGSWMRAGFALEAAAAEKAIIVYPDGLGGTWDTDTLAGLTRDVAFVDAVAAALTTSHCVAEGKVYATGISRGAYFTNQMVCRSKTVWRGIATHAGGGPWAVVNSEYDSNGQLKCTTASVAALQVQGLADGVVPPSEGQKARDYWRLENGCQTSTQAYAPSPCAAYVGCAKPEVYCAIPGLGHAFWANAAQVTWAFLSAQ